MGEWWESCKEAPGIIYTEKWGMMRTPQGDPWNLITGCKIYTEKWGMMRIPRWGPRGFLIAKCKIYTGKWGNDENPARRPWDFSSRNVKFTRGNGGMMRIPQWGPWDNLHGEIGQWWDPRKDPRKSLITECKIYTEKWGMMRIRKEVPGNFSSRNVKFTLRNGGMMRVRKDPRKSLITECKIYTGKWRNDENPAMRSLKSHHEM